MSEVVTTHPDDQIRVHYLHTPNLNPGFIRPLGWVLLSITITFVTHYATKAILPYFISHAGTREDTSTILPFLVFIACLFLLFARSHLVLMAMPRGRTKRLDQIVRSSPTRHRLPHRFVEKALRGTPQQATPNMKLLNNFPPQHVIIINADSSFVLTKLAENNREFEPIEISRFGQLATVMGITLPASDTDSAVDRRQIRQDILMILVCAPFVLAGISEIAIGRMGAGISFMSVPGFYLAVRWILPLLVESKRWVVPGAIAFSTLGVWRQSNKIDVCSRTNASIAIDLRGGRILVFAGRTYIFHVPRAVAPGILAAWLSTARTPTESEIRSFLGLPAQADSNA